MPNFLQFKVHTNVAKCAIFRIYIMLAFCNNNNIIDWLFPYKIIFILTLLPAEERQVAARLQDMTGTVCRPYMFGSRWHSLAYDRDHHFSPM
jgi:hypothetical protein